MGDGDRVTIAVAVGDTRHQMSGKSKEFFKSPSFLPLKLMFLFTCHRRFVNCSQNREMTGGSLFRLAKKAICRGGSSRGGSSRGESSMETESITPSTLVHPDSQEEIECSGSQQTSRHSFCGTDPAPEEGVWLIGSYLGVVARDPMLAPIAFPDWRNKGIEPFKKKILAEVEAEHWDSRPIEEILETVLAGVNQMQWCQLVNQWSKPEDQTQACKLLAKEGLTPKDDNIEANEIVFAIVMGPEHSGRVRTQGVAMIIHLMPDNLLMSCSITCDASTFWKVWNKTFGSNQELRVWLLPPYEKWPHIKWRQYCKVRVRILWLESLDDMHSFLSFCIASLAFFQFF
ncbi:hypothetical protein IEQ34_003663 [Dendrobium chrysotoxum]|uniref:Uncharacterized protein n=1 Tax=Dendrobium chrysotoxum TaxID=161865 RepID=A0AAV7GX07_DENCH|nr:hypothetical protein IEQ34_003663 [Dendrobium chrysotoxum]